MKNKAAIIKAAQRFASKGQIDRAIAEWEKLLAHGKDGNIYNTIGDLFLKKGATQEAIKSFSKAAESFRENGFYLKAMALYKKILNISPSQVDALIALAELNVEKGLIGNAIENFLAAAEIYTREGSTQKALEIYKKILKTAPTNINLKIKMAEFYLKIGLPKEAAREYVEIAEDYLEKKELEKAQEFYLRAINSDPQSISSLLGLSKISEEFNDIKGAFKYLKDALSIDPDNKELLLHYSMLAISTDNIEEAKTTLSRLLKLDPSHIQAKKLLGDIYLKEGLLDKAWEELLPYIDEALQAERWIDALELLERFKDLYPIPVKRRLVTIYRGRGDKETAIKELRELARLYEEKELFYNAFQTYKELLTLNPHDNTAMERLKKLESTVKTITPPDMKPVEEKPIPEKPETPSQKIETISQKDLEEKISTLSPVKGEVSGIFHKLKKDIEKEIEEKDHETHYNLGVAYKETGLLDEAISEFRIAAKDSKNTLKSSRMIASCYMEKGEYLLAIKELKKIIETLSSTDEGYLDVKYDLAGAYVKNKDYGKAIELYSEIHKKDPEFKDVAHKIEILKTLMSRTKERPKKSKKDRVSYI